jgi:hypothetical protein
VRTMGVGSAISACLGKVATVFTDRRLRLRFFVVLSTVRQARALPSFVPPPPLLFGVHDTHARRHPPPRLRSCSRL